MAEKDSFPGLALNASPTMFEAMGGAPTLLGWNSGPFRDARIKVTTGRLALSALNAYGTKIDLGELAVEDGDVASLSPIPVNIQLKAALKKTLILGLGLVVSFTIILFLRAETAPDTLALVIVAISCMVVAGLGGFLPTLLKADPRLSAVEIRTKDGNALIFALKPDQIPEATHLLRGAGLKVENSTPNRA